jgi:Ca2+-binding RTX toxin-like protein
MSCPTGFEGLTSIGSAATDAFANNLGNTLDGTQNAAVNHLHGGFGDDLYKVGAVDIVVEQTWTRQRHRRAPWTGNTALHTRATCRPTWRRLWLGDDLGASDIEGGGGDDQLTGNASINVITGFFR